MKIETKCLHEGYKPENGGPGVMPIVQSTTYRFDSTAKIASLFDMPTECIYSRFANPTCDAVEKKIASLEGGVGAMLTSSGQAASLLSILNLCSAGDSFIAASTIYGGTINLFGVTLKKLGIECIWADAEASEEEVQKLFKPNTKAVFGETLANPALTVFDIEKWANIAHKNNVPLIVDNTFATPVLCRPIEWGADIVIHSTTKYMDGHAVQGGGVIVNICSVGATHQTSGAAYCASKGAVLAATKNTAFMYMEEGIRCNAVSPGGVITDIPLVMPPSDEFGFSRTSKLLDFSGELAMPEDLADAILFLASDQSRYVNGEELKCDGGWTCF